MEKSGCVRYSHSITAIEYPLLLRVRERRLPAGRAVSGQKEFVAGHLKALGKVRLKLNAAAGHLKNFAALVAAKMMVMLFARNFIARRLSGQSDRDQPVLFNQGADVPIHGRDADAFHHLASVV